MTVRYEIFIGGRQTMTDRKGILHAWEEADAKRSGLERDRGAMIPVFLVSRQRGQYLNQYGKWGHHLNARHFSDMETAERNAADHGGECISLATSCSIPSCR